MIINTLFTFISILCNVIARIIVAPLVPIDFQASLIATLNFLFDNFTMINMICHLNVLKTFMLACFSVFFFRRVFNLIRFLYSKAHTK